MLTLLVEISIWQHAVEDDSIALLRLHSEAFVARIVALMSFSLSERGFSSFLDIRQIPGLPWELEDMSFEEAFEKFVQKESRESIVAAQDLITNLVKQCDIEEREAYFEVVSSVLSVDLEPVEVRFVFLVDSVVDQLKRLRNLAGTDDFVRNLHNIEHPLRNMLDDIGGLVVNPDVWAGPGLGQHAGIGNSDPLIG